MSGFWAIDLHLWVVIRAIFTYILFSLYLVFCLVYRQFWVLYMCFYLVGDVQAKGSKNGQRKAIRSQKKQIWAKAKSMPRHELIHAAACAKSATQVKNPRATCRSMKRSCRGMPRQCRKGNFRSCRSMPYSCRGMETINAKLIFGK